MVGRVMNRQHKTLRNGLLLAISALMSFGISAKDVKVADCPIISLGTAPILPATDSKTRKVIMMPVAIGEINQAQDAAINSTLEQAVSEIISKAGADMLARSVAEKLGTEIQRYEARGESNYKTELATDAVEIHISDVSFATKYVQASTYERDGKKVTNPPKCKHDARVSGYIRILSVNPISERKSISINSSRSESIETTTDECEVSESQIEGYLRAAAKKAIQNEDTKAEIFEQFRPIGYVMQARKCKKKN